MSSFPVIQKQQTEKKSTRRALEERTLYLFLHIHTSSSYLFAHSYDERNDDSFSRTDGRRDGFVVVVFSTTTGTKLRDGFGFIGFIVVFFVFITSDHSF